MSVEQLEVKTALRKGHLPDAFTSSLYAVSPYRGCGHGCLYCDGRAEKYYVEGDFATHIQARSELPERLASELPRIREHDRQGRRSLLSLGSGVTDVYQPVEADLGLTRRCVEVLADSAQPCLVITKSSHIQRDLDLWTKVARGPGMVLLMTIAQADDRIRQRFEPGASPLDERWETLQAFRNAGAATGVLAMPLLPGISDDEASLRQIYARASEIGVDYLMPGGLTLRPGRQKELYFAALEGLAPELGPRYRHIYGEDRASGNPVWEARKALQTRIEAVASGFDLPFLLPHRIHSRILPSYESLYLLFLQMEALWSDRPKEVPRLRQARERWGAWLTEKRSIFRRHRTFEPTWIDGMFGDLLTGTGLEAVLANDRLASWARKVVAGAVFDPLTRSLGSLGPDP